jgi:CBS domain containing-hemolysin-like protein
MDGDTFGSGWWISALIFLALVLFSGLFSGGEVAIFALGRSGRLRRRGESPRYRRLQRLLKNSERTLTTLQLGNLIAGLGALLFAADVMDRLWTSGGMAAMWLGIVLGGPIVWVFGEALPMSLAARRPDTFARRATPFLMVAIWILAAPRILFTRITARLLRSRLTPRQMDQSIQEEEEFKSLLSASEVIGILEEEEREMIDGVFEFAETTAEEIMTPRTDIEGYPVSMPQKDMLEALRQSPFSRIVVYEDTLDHIVGMVAAKDVLLNPDTPWMNFSRPPLVVPAGMELDELLTQFKRTRSHLAVVMDEYGGTAGIVTLHDLIEEIVGDIPEEEEQLDRDIEQIEPGVYLVSGRVEVSDCNDALETNFPLDKARTLAGLVFMRLGRVPEVGEEVRLANASLRVVELEENRIERLEIHPRSSRYGSAAHSASTPASPDTGSGLPWEPEGTRQ